MKPALIFVVVLACLLLFVAGARSQTAQASVAAQPQQQEPIKVETGAEEVFLDLIVRDKKGRPIKDLKADEVRVFEDGKAQALRGFRYAGGEPPAGAGAVIPGDVSATAATTRPIGVHFNLVTLVFDRLSTEGRTLARQGATDFLGSELSPNTYVAVFGLDQSLFALQEFTNDRKLAQAAVEKATGQSYSVFPAASQEVRDRLESAARATAAGTEIQSPGRGGSHTGVGSGASAAAMAQMILGMLNYSQEMDSAKDSRSSVFGLMALVEAQGLLSGRKTVIYFSEGLEVPPNVDIFFKQTISDANKNNVSFYSVDARGLVIDRQSKQASQALSRAAAVNATQTTTNNTLTREDIMSGEAAERVIRMDVQETLGTLARDTGGFAVANSNDLRVGMRRVSDDIRGYYELTYKPDAMVYDGKFRAIKVDVMRPGVMVQARSGYFAVPPAGPGVSALLPYEQQMLAALSAETLPKQFDFRTQAMHFAQQPDGSIDHAIVIQSQLANFGVEKDEKAKVARTRFSAMAVVKDAQGRIVRKVSENYPLEGPLDKVPQMQKGEFIFSRTMRVPPGRFTLETVVYDRISQKASARRVVMVVAPSKGVRISSLALIRRAEPLKPDHDPNDPFTFQTVRIVPNLGEALSGSKGLPVFLVVYPAAGNPAAPELVLECLKEGKLVAQSAVPLGAADDKGRIAFAGVIPFSSLGPGHYDLHVVARQKGADSAEENITFEVNQ